MVVIALTDGLEVHVRVAPQPVGDGVDLEPEPRAGVEVGEGGVLQGRFQGRDGAFKLKIPNNK